MTLPPHRSTLLATDAAVVVGQPLDVVFAQVSASLHLNDLQGNRSGGGPVHRPSGNEQGAARPGDEGLPPHFKLTATTNHDPMLTAVKVSLPADAQACLNPESLDEIVITFAEILVPAPGTQCAGEKFRGGRFRGLRKVGQLLVVVPVNRMGKLWES